MFLFAALFCPCRGLAFSIPSAHSVESACCETCPDEKQSRPGDSEGVPTDCGCEIGCCASFLVPDKGDSSDEDAGKTIIWAIPLAHNVEILVSFSRSASHAPDLFGSGCISIGSLLPDLSSLLI